MSKDNENSVYIFHNIKHNIFLFTNCENYENAMDIFNLSGFDDREQWKIFVKCGLGRIRVQILREGATLQDYMTALKMLMEAEAYTGERLTLEKEKNEK